MSTLASIVSDSLIALALCNQQPHRTFQVCLTAFGMIMQEQLAPNLVKANMVSKHLTTEDGKARLQTLGTCIFNEHLKSPIVGWSQKDMVTTSFDALYFAKKNVIFFMEVGVA